MTALPLLGWLVAADLVLVAAWLAIDLQEARRHERERRIATEEAQAWADEFERERDALAAECGRLREERATLQSLYTLRTRESLAANFWIVARNVEHRRRLG